MSYGDYNDHDDYGLVEKLENLLEVWTDFRSALKDAVMADNPGDWEGIRRRQVAAIESSLLQESIWLRASWEQSLEEIVYDLTNGNEDDEFDQA